MLVGLVGGWDRGGRESGNGREGWPEGPLGLPEETSWGGFFRKCWLCRQDLWRERQGNISCSMIQAGLVVLARRTALLIMHFQLAELGLDRTSQLESRSRKSFLNFGKNKYNSSAKYAGSRKICFKNSVSKSSVPQETVRPTGLLALLSSLSPPIRAQLWRRWTNHKPGLNAIAKVKNLKAEFIWKLSKTKVASLLIMTNESETENWKLSEIFCFLKNPSLDLFVILDKLEEDKICKTSSQCSWDDLYNV